MAGNRISDRIEKRLLAYAAGAVGTLAVSHDANAVLVITDVDVTTASHVSGLYRLETFTDGASSVSLVAAGAGSHTLQVYSGTFSVSIGGSTHGDPESGGSALKPFYITRAYNPVAVNLDVGDVVTSATGGEITDNLLGIAPYRRDFARNGFAMDVRDYTGFKIRMDGRDHYGWLDFTANSDYSFTFHRFAVETSAGVGALVTAAPVPEPGQTAAVFALGAAGLAAYRRRRAAVKKDSE